MPFSFNAMTLMLMITTSAAGAQTWEGVDLGALSPKQGTKVEDVPAAAAIPPHPEWGRLAYFMGINFRTSTGRQQTEVRPAFLKTWGQDCDVKIVQTMPVTAQMWRSLGFITNQPYWGEVMDELGWTREQWRACPGLPRNTLTRLVNEDTGEEAFFVEKTRISEAEVARFLATDEPGIAYKLPDALRASLRESGMWNYALSGMFSMRPQPWARNFSTRFAYAALMEAYSDRVEAGDGSCRFAGDISGAVTTSSESASRGRRIVHFPPSHEASVARIVSGPTFTSQPLFREYLKDARVIVDALPCADPLLAALRENLMRWHMKAPALSDAERAQLAAATARAAPRAERTYPVFQTDWRPFVDSCMANLRSRSLERLTHGNLVHCACAEYITQVAGDRALYDLFVKNWISAFSDRTPKSPRWVEMWNGMCSGDPEKAPPVAVEHAAQY